jgi:NAD(P)-dependent dehydrogenase (short-subunit alcohol dehydrogenase family)
VNGRPTALVTGAGRGIGAEIARKLASVGWSVAIVARSEGALAEVAAKTGALPFVLDVTDAAAVERVVAEVGRVDLLVNNAGTGGVGGATWMKDAAAWWRVMEVNVLGPLLSSRAVLPGMCERGEGRIVNVASNAAFFRLERDWDASIDSAYQASKAALVRLTEALAAEACAFGVSVFAISPGMVKTEMTEQVFADVWDDEAVWTPPEQTGELVSFIATGALDALSGRYIHAAADDWKSMPGNADAILAGDLHALRLRRPS